MWVYEKKEGILKNITVVYKFLDGELKLIQLLAHKGYALRYINDEGFTDDYGNYYSPTYSYQVTGGAWLKIEDYEAVPIEDDTETIR